MATDNYSQKSMIEQIDSRVDQLGDLIDREIQVVRTSTRHFWIGGALLILVIIGYMSWIFSHLRPLADPEEAAILLQQTALNRLPQFSASLEAALRDAAPDLTRQATQRVLDAIPRIRKEVEKRAGRVGDDLASYIDSHLGELIDQVIRDHKKEIKELIPQLKTKEKAQEFTNLLETACRKSIMDVLDVQLKEYLEALRAIRHKLERLQSAPDLTPEEKLEREMVATWAIFIDQALREAKAGSKPLAK